MKTLLLIFAFAVLSFVETAKEADFRIGFFITPELLSEHVSPAREGILISFGGHRDRLELLSNAFFARESGPGTFSTERQIAVFGRYRRIFSDETVKPFFGLGAGYVESTFEDRVIILGQQAGFRTVDRGPMAMISAGLERWLFSRVVLGVEASGWGAFLGKEPTRWKAGLQIASISLSYKL